MKEVIRTAQCACGCMSIECVGEPEKISVCHCRECQRRTGSVFGIAAFYDLQKVKIAGESTIYTRESDSGFAVIHHFCPSCGSTVCWYPDRKPGKIAVGVGCFADSEFPGPHQQVYEEHQHSWVSLSFIKSKR